MIEEAVKIVSCFVSCMSNFRSNRSDPHFVSRHVEEALDIINSMHIEHFFTITITDDNSMLINGVRMSLDVPETKKFFLKLQHKGVITILLSKGVRAKELQRFLFDLASSGGFFHSYVHIALERSKQLPRIEMFPTGHGLKDELIQIKRIFRDISAKGRIDMITVDAVVGSLIANVRKEGNLLSLFETLKEDSNDLYVHSAKVAMLSILQGEHLNLGNALLFDIGLAALLHDIGKTLMPNKLLDKQNSLSEAEWTVMKNHPAYGAALLASLNKVPEIAITVAYEHHRKYDGTGYPEIRKRPGKQHIISQIVAISDFYCAMSDDLPHRKTLNNTSILGLLIETAGSEFNPLLVNNFVQAM
ncbi:MAG: hypothetical protein A2Y97_02045 [Nitrospirae bacterium RBG_13_39_12]|nr:MAG: hypothetical protein A2Y97_02045 [Nitrospirae bacterium RBG_13_39_12]